MSRGRIKGALLLLLLGSACGEAEKEKAKLAEIQHQADDRVAQVERDAKDKIAAAQKMVEQMQSDLADAGAQAKAEVDEEINKAKGEADKLAAEATKAMAKARAAYKENARGQLATLAKDADEIRAKAAKAPPKVKTQIDQALKDLGAKKDAARKNIDAFDTATLETLRTVKIKADQGLAELKQIIHSARAKLPPAS